MPTINRYNLDYTSDTISVLTSLFPDFVSNLVHCIIDSIRTYLPDIVVDYIDTVPLISILVYIFLLIILYIVCDKELWIRKLMAIISFIIIVIHNVLFYVSIPCLIELAFLLSFYKGYKAFCGRNDSKEDDKYTFKLFVAILSLFTYLIYVPRLSDEFEDDISRIKEEVEDFCTNFRESK